MDNSGAECTISVTDNFESFKDNVELSLVVKEIDPSAWAARGEIVFVTDDVERPYEYSVDSENKFTINANDPGAFIVEAVTVYNGVKRITDTEPFYITTLY
jgi:hypothetical protein